MEFRKTPRGFAVVEFRDRYNIECAIQKSSLATEDAIWFGPSDHNAKQLVPGSGWAPYEIPQDVSITTRAHLTREQVAALLPILQHFVNTGEVAYPAPICPGNFGHPHDYSLRSDGTCAHCGHAEEERS